MPKHKVFILKDKEAVLVAKSIKKRGKHMKKKGYLFTLDALMAIGIIMVGLVVVNSMGSKTPSTLQIGFYSDDLMSLLANMKIYEVNDPYVDQLISEGNIQNMDNTLLEQAGEFYYRENNGPACTGNDCITITYNLLESITEGALPPMYYFRIKVYYGAGEDEFDEVYKTAEPNPDSEMITTSRRIVAGLYDDTTLWSYGTQIEVWQ